MAQAAAFTGISSLVSSGVSYLFPADGPRLKDIKVTASTYGNIIPEGFGSVRVAGNMIWSTEVRETKHKRKAGKGGSYYNMYTYDVDFAMSFCVGPVDEVRRIWADGKLIYDTTGSSEAVASGKFNIRIYFGDEKQIPDPIIENDKGTGETPAYRGLVYVVFDNFQLADFGNRIPQMAAEIYRGALGEIGDIPLGVPAGTGNVTDNLLADWDRGFFWGGGITSGATRFVRKFRFSDGKQIQRLDIDHSNILAATPDGGFIYSPNLANFPIFYRVGANGQVIGHYGEYDTIFDPGFGSDKLISNAFIATEVAYTLAGTAFYMNHGVFSDISFLQLLTDGRMVFAGGDHGWNETPGWRIYGRVATTCARPAVGPTPVWYTCHGSTFYADGNVRISRISPGGIVQMISHPFEGANTLNNPAQAGQCYFDQSTNSVIFFYTDCDGVNHVASWPEGGTSLAWNITFNFVAPAGQARLEDGQMAWVTNTNFAYILDTRSGKWINPPATKDYLEVDDDELPLPEVGTPDVPIGYLIEPGGGQYRNQLYDTRRSIVIATEGGNEYDRLVRLNGAATDASNLGGIVEALLRKTGLRSGSFDLTPLYEIPVPGYAWGTATDVKNLLSELKTIYQFDLVESNGMLVAKLRGSEDSNVTIKSLALGSSSQDTTDFWRETRADESELPMAISLIYTNIEDDYEQSTARAKRIQNPVPSMYSRQVATFETNLMLTPSDAKTRVHRMLYAQWGERTKHEAILPWAYAHLDPSDLMTVTFEDGREYFERLHYTEIGADFAIQMESFSQDNGAYTVVKTGDGGGSGRTQVIPIPKPARAFVLNTPLLRDVDSSGGAYSRYYGALGVDGDGAFIGATMYRSTNSEDYEALYSENNEVEWGYVRGTVPPPAQGPFSLDWETQITIQPMSGEFLLDSITDAQMAAGLNLVMIGDEALQFRDAVENADGSWTISNLYRGRRGTEWACDTHDGGEAFLFLDTSTIESLSESLDAYLAPRWFKGVGQGRSLNETDEERIEYVPRDLMPYAPTQIEREITTNGDIDITWDRRTRLGGGLLNGTGDVPLNEDSERYEIYLLDAPFSGDPSRPEAPADFVRKFDTTAPEVTYTQAMQSTDSFGNNVDTLHVVVYQLSAAVGRGFPGIRSIEPWRDL